MCKVSDKLKLCTCKTTNVEDLKHYWILYKYADIGVYRMGDYIMPEPIAEKEDRYNINTLQALLNEGNCFDFEIELEENDRLEFHFSCTQNSNSMIPAAKGYYFTYTFSYKSGKWTEEEEFDPFHNNLDEKLFGKIVKPFLNKQRK